MMIESFFMLFNMSSSDHVPQRIRGITLYVLYKFMTYLLTYLLTYLTKFDVTLEVRRWRGFDIAGLR